MDVSRAMTQPQPLPASRAASRRRRGASTTETLDRCQVARDLDDPTLPPLVRLGPGGDYVRDIDVRRDAARSVDTALGVLSAVALVSLIALAWWAGIAAGIDPP